MPHLPTFYSPSHPPQSTLLAGEAEQSKHSEFIHLLSPHCHNSPRSPLSPLPLPVTPPPSSHLSPFQSPLPLPVTPPTSSHPSPFQSPLPLPVTPPPSSYPSHFQSPLPPPPHHYSDWFSPGWLHHIEGWGRNSWSLVSVVKRVNCLFDNWTGRLLKGSRNNCLQWRPL